MYFYKGMGTGMMEEFVTSSVETGKCQCLEDGVEQPNILHGKDIGSSD
jgi:hypothetical protein